MTFAALQQEFMAHVLEEDRPLPPGWDQRMAKGLAVYRNAYRARLVGALTEIFPRTLEWVGQDAFNVSAAHHLILCPPTSWTLDMAGAGFVETLTELFTSDPDVPDLAWLEWAMHLAYTAADGIPLDASGFAAATTAFDEEDWAALRLAFTPSLQIREVRSDCAALWHALGTGEQPVTAPILEAGLQCLVWREALSPVFALVPEAEGECLSRMRKGIPFGEICDALAQSDSPDQAAATAGAMLGRWLSQGIVSGVLQSRPKVH